MARMVATGARVRVVALVFVCLGCCFPQTRANAAVANRYAAPNLTGAAAVADGSVAKPYIAIVKECFPFSSPNPTAPGGVSGYLIDQMAALNTPDSPLHIKYAISNSTYTGTLEQLRWGARETFLVFFFFLLFNPSPLPLFSSPSTNISSRPLLRARFPSRAAAPRFHFLNFFQHIPPRNSFSSSGSQRAPPQQQLYTSDEVMTINDEQGGTTTTTTCVILREREYSD